MERFTEHSSNIDKDSFRVKPNMSMYKSIDKLGKYEDLEEEIGCPLEVRCKLYNIATVYGINGKERVIACWKDRFITVLCINNMKIIHKYSDYEETWWLKADMSE